jgi:hypothetical protein
LLQVVQEDQHPLVADMVDEAGRVDRAAIVADEAGSVTAANGTQKTPPPALDRPAATCSANRVSPEPRPRSSSRPARSR